MVKVKIRRAPGVGNRDRRVHDPGTRRVGHRGIRRGRDGARVGEEPTLTPTPKITPREDIAIGGDRGWWPVVIALVVAAALGSAVYARRRALARRPHAVGFGR